MEQKTIRLLRADEIECRIGTISEKGVSLLLYKDARADMKILDEVYGPMNWQRKHEMIGGSLYCTVSIWDGDKKQWISKMDVGTESYTEKEKGQASDSFKRACVSLGIGRELYTAPFIWIGASKVRIEKRPDNASRGGEKLYTYDKFRITDISYGDNREITGLTVINQDGNVVYILREKDHAQKPSENTAAAKKQQKPAANTPAAKPEQIQTGNTPAADTRPGQNHEPDRTQEINRELARTGVALDAVLERYGVSSIQEMDTATYRKAMNSLKKTKAKAA